jgi:hypothetical protein
MSTEMMAGFGHKQAWLAVREAAPEVVIAALGLRDLGEVSWRDGVDVAYLTDDRLLVTPPLPGALAHRWTLVAGRWLLGPKSGVDIIVLSATLGTEVQLFSSYRVGERHQWRRAVDGELRRAFGYLGETGEITDWRGDPDPGELAAGLPAELVETDDGDEDEAGRSLLISESDVLRLAAAWSIDPTTLAGQPASARPRVAAADPQ